MTFGGGKISGPPQAPITHATPLPPRHPEHDTPHPKIYQVLENTLILSMPAGAHE